jgi:hypothetical protein
MFGTESFKTLAAAGALALLAGGAGAATVTTSCPGDDLSGTRDFTVTIDDANGPAGCVLTGIGPSGPGTGSDILTAISPATLLDKTDTVGPSGVVLSVTGIDDLSGLWSIVVPTGYILTNVHLLFQSGTANGDPDWAVLSIPQGILSGTWSIIDPTCSKGCNGEQSLSHANVYGTLVPATVPLPAAGLLLIGALGGLAALRRRRNLA